VAEAEFDAKAEAKRLMRLARTAALATLDRASGAPLATLVAVASDYDGAPLLLLSSLAAHTKNLAVHPVASVLLTSAGGRGDPLNRPRLTLGGPLAPHDDARAFARYVARNPKSKLYASFSDFRLFRMAVEAVHFNGGFARAAPLTPAEILTDLAGAEALVTAEATLIDEVNARRAAALTRLAGAKAAWRAIGLDPEGLDLAAGARAARVSFAAPARDPPNWRTALARLLEE
jgi:putative heme iron utilization protein